MARTPRTTAGQRTGQVSMCRNDTGGHDTYRRGEEFGGKSHYTPHPPRAGISPPLPSPGGFCISQASPPSLRSKRLSSARSLRLPRTRFEKMPRHRASSLLILPEEGTSLAISVKTVSEGAFPRLMCEVLTVRMLFFGERV